MRTSGWLGLLVVLGACGGGEDTTTPAKPAAPPAAAAPAAPRRDPIAGGPYPALFVAQAQFVDKVGADGKATSVPGPAKLTIVRKTDAGWTSSILEDPDSNVLHKAVQTADGILTIGGQQALLRTWTFADGAW
jgi:hypothetical protein